MYSLGGFLLALLYGSLNLFPCVQTKSTESTQISETLAHEEKEQYVLFPAHNLFP